MLFPFVWKLSQQVGHWIKEANLNYKYFVQICLIILDAYLFFIIVIFNAQLYSVQSTVH